MISARHARTSTPIAKFTANVTEGNAPLVVWFTDLSTGSPNNWFWSFGDGNTSNKRNPVHTYATAGTYNVSLTARNAYGEDTETKIDYINVLAPPVADFTANITTGMAPLAVQFNDTSTGEPTNWFWNFGDGNTSALPNPNHTYVNPGTYTVSLTASNAYGEDTRTRTDYITVLEPIVANFTANVTSGPLAVQFTDQSTGNVTVGQRDFGDNSTSTLQSPNHTYECRYLHGHPERKQ